MNYSINNNILQGAWEDWLPGVADWRLFVTFTFRDQKYEDVAKALFRSWVQYMNRGLLGKNYHNKVRHSYFSYAVGSDYQIRDAIHFHALIDLPLDFARSHSYWNNRCGFQWIEKIKDKSDVITYVTKYVLRGGEMDVFKAHTLPSFQLPYWWKR